jgi:hypothetical protein
MSNPEAPHDDPTTVEQPVQTDQTNQTDAADTTDAQAQTRAQTERLDTTQTHQTEQLDTADATRAFAFDSPHTDPVGEGTVADDAAWPPAVPERPSGPHAPAIVLGLVCLAVAVIVLAQELGSLSVDWGDIGPLGIVVAGALLVLFGLAGLLSSRRKAH